jgi:hypothetical protein
MTTIAEHGALSTFRRIVPAVVLGALPVAVASTMFVVAVGHGPLAWDFRNELYPQTTAFLEGHNPYPDGLWPPLAMLVAVPFTLVPSVPAGIAIALAGLACMALALRLVDVRDWRVYGVTALWPSVMADIRIAHLTPLLCLLTAMVWRYRARPYVTGAALGIACGLKFLLWPLGVWLLATGRVRAVLVASVVAAASLLVIAPLAPLDEYVRTLREVTRTFDQDGYTVYGILTRLGAGEAVARGSTLALGVALLAAIWRTKSFAVAVAAALVLSPIVWLDFYALAAVPLAIARPRLSLVWFVPLATWGMPSSAIDTGVITGGLRTMVLFAFVLWVAAGRDVRSPKS